MRQAQASGIALWVGEGLAWRAEERSSRGSCARVFTRSGATAVEDARQSSRADQWARSRLVVLASTVVVSRSLRLTISTYSSSFQKTAAVIPTGQPLEDSHWPTAISAGDARQVRVPANRATSATPSTDPGFSGLLTGQIGATLSERQRRFLHNIEEAGQHLLELINDVLDLSKVEAGKLELRPEIVPVEALLEPVSAAGRTAAQSKGVLFDVQGQASDGLLLDPTRVRQVLFNLVSNAVKFTPAGGSVLLRSSLDGPDLVIEVKDTGIGIPPEARDRVFGVFERFHEGRVAAEGTGLGLALTNAWAKRMGGSIAFRARGRGHCHSDYPTSDRARSSARGPGRETSGDADLSVAVASSLHLLAEVGPHCRRTASPPTRPAAAIVDLRFRWRGEQILRD